MRAWTVAVCDPSWVGTDCDSSGVPASSGLHLSHDAMVRLVGECRTTLALTARRSDCPMLLALGLVQRVTVLHPDFFGGT